MKIIKKIIRKLFLPIKSLFLKNKRLNHIDSDEALNELREYYMDSGRSCVINNRMQMTSHDLDIIIPMYNVEKYLSECIESVLHQNTKYDYRIILIDDGSFDQTADNVAKYLMDERVILISQRNSGLSAARNSGLNICDGKYVLFLDSDDFLFNNTVSTLLDTAFKEDADIVQGDFVYCDENSKLQAVYKSSYGKIGLKDLNGFAWGKVIKSEMFKSICFPENYWFEDSLMSMVIYPRASIVYSLDETVYAYRTNNKGITKTSKVSPKALDTLYVILRLNDDRKALKIKNDVYYLDLMLFSGVVAFKRIASLDEKLKKDFFVVYSSFINNEFSNLWTSKYSRIAYAFNYYAYDYFKLIVPEY